MNKPLLRLVPHFTSRPVVLMLVIASGLLYSATIVALPAAGAYVIGLMLTGQPAGGLLPVIAILVLVAGFAQWWQAIVGHDWAYRLLKDLRLRVVDGIARATPGRLLGKRTGELADTAKNDVAQTELFFAHTAGDYVGAILSSIASLAFVAILSWPVALLMAAMMVLVAAVPAVLARAAGRQGAAVRAASGEVAAETVDVIQGLRELSLARRARDYAERVLNRTESLGTQLRAYAKRAGFELLAAEILLGLGLVGLIALAVSQVEPRWLPVLAVLGMSALAPIATVSATARTLGEVSAAADRVLEIIGYPPHVTETSSPQRMSAAVPAVEFSDVRFGYPSSGQVLSGLSFRIEPGETVALVGRSGAGKTTTAHLLLRFWDVDAGAVRVDDVDVRDLAESDLRRTVTVVSQDGYLFAGSVADNLRLGRPDATDEEIARVARLVGAQDLVAKPVGERGMTLSGGQRQRIAMARALLTHAPVLILDEAVSSLDTESEQALHENLAATRRSRTTLLIAHRISTIRQADRVVVLADGCVVATGKHDELIATSETYRKILASQQDETVPR